MIGPCPVDGLPLTIHASLPARCPCGPEAQRTRVGGLAGCHPAGNCPEYGHGGLLCNTCAGRVHAILNLPIADGPQERRRRGKQQDEPLTPEQKAEAARRKARHAEAIEYVTSYTGSWGLPLDVRADRRWGTKHLKLSDGQVDALLKGRDRDLERAQEQAAAVADPRQQAAAQWLLTAVPRPRGGFEQSMVMIARQRRPLTENQLAAVERWRDREVSSAAPAPRVPAAPGPADPEAPGLAPQPPAGPAVGGRVTEGWYVVDGQPWKVQHTRQDHSRLYAKRLVVDDQRRGSWEYVAGGLRTILQRGRPMSVEEAAAFGKLYGVCAVCGRELTDEQSIERGIGPVCLANLGG